MFLLDHPRGSGFKNDLSDEFLLLFSLVETRLIYMFFEFFPYQNIFSDDVFVGSCLWIPIQKRLIRRVSPLKSPSGNSSDLHVFRVFSLAKTSFLKMFHWIIPRGSRRNDLSDEFPLLDSPSRNSSNLDIFRVFPLLNMFWIIPSWPRETSYQTSFSYWKTRLIFMCPPRCNIFSLFPKSNQ
jgi:hypothetical protein